MVNLQQGLEQTIKKLVKEGKLKEAYDLAKNSPELQKVLIQACVENKVTLSQLEDAELFPESVADLMNMFSRDKEKFDAECKKNSLAMRLFVHAIDDETGEFVYTLYPLSLLSLEDNFVQEVVPLADSLFPGKSHHAFFLNDLIRLAENSKYSEVPECYIRGKTISREDIYAASLYPENEMEIYSWYAIAEGGNEQDNQDVLNKILEAIKNKKTYTLPKDKEISSALFVLYNLAFDENGKIKTLEEQKKLQQYVWNNLDVLPFDEGKRADFDHVFGGLENKTPEQKSLYPYLTLSDVYKDEEFLRYLIENEKVHVFLKILDPKESDYAYAFMQGNMGELPSLIEESIKKEKNKDKKEQLKKLKRHVEKIIQTEQGTPALEPQEQKNESSGSKRVKTKPKCDDIASLVLHILDGRAKNPEQFGESTISYQVGRKKYTFGKNKTKKEVLLDLLKSNLCKKNLIKLFSQRTPETQKTVLHYLIDLNDDDLKENVLNLIKSMSKEDKKIVFNNKYGNEILEYAAAQEDPHWYSALVGVLLPDCNQLVNVEAEVNFLNMRQTTAEEFFKIIRDYKYQDDDGNNYLHYAVKFDNLAIIRGFGERYWTDSLIHQKNKDGKTPFDLAIEKENLDAIHQLVIYGSLDDKDKMIEAIEKKIKSLPKGSQACLYLKGVEAILNQKTMPQNLDETTKKYLESFCEECGIEYPAQASNNSSSLSKRLAQSEQSSLSETSTAIARVAAPLAKGRFV